MSETTTKISKETLDALAEARKISRDPDVPGCKTMSELKEALEEED